MSYLEGKSVLIVDDEPAIRELFKAEFSFQGCECVEAESGRQAFEIYKQNQFDAVVSDIKMPDGDGMYFLKKIRELGEPSSLLVFITGFSDLPIEEFYEGGADLVVQKPFEVDVVVKMIEDSLQAPRSQWRKMLRMVTIMNIEIESPDHEEALQLLTYNMSRRGFFVKSKDFTPPIGTVLGFKVHLKNIEGERTFSGQGLVRWVRKEGTLDRPAGFGIEYMGANAKVMDELAGMVGLDYLYTA